MEEYIAERKSCLVSIIIPVYNTEKYLEKCLDSIVNQIYKDFEVILINDGSEDQSGDICDRYADEYDYIHVYHQENRGVVSARNLGVHKAKGKYITFVDSDDWVENDFLSVLVGTIEEREADIVITGIWRNINGIDTKIFNNIKPGVYEKEKLISFYEKMLHYEGFHEMGIMPYLWNKIFKRDLLLDNTMGDVDSNIYEAEDQLIVFPYLLQSKKVVVTGDCLYHYEWRPSSVTNTRRFNYFENTSRVFLHLNRKFSETEYYDIMRPQLEAHMRLLVFIENPGAFAEAFPEAYSAAQRDVFPFRKVPKDSKIILYGAGYLGKIFHNQLEVSAYCNVVAWVDKAFREVKYNRIGVVSLESAQKKEYDFVVIAVKDKRISDSIKKDLIENGIEKEKIITQ